MPKTRTSTIPVSTALIGLTTSRTPPSLPVPSRLGSNLVVFFAVLPSPPSCPGGGRVFSNVG